MQVLTPREWGSTCTKLFIYCVKANSIWTALVTFGMLPFHCSQNAPVTSTVAFSTPTRSLFSKYKHFNCTVFQICRLSIQGTEQIFAVGQFHARWSIIAKNQTNICSSSAVNCKSTTFAVFLVRLRGLKNDKKMFFACVAETTVKHLTTMLDYSWQLCCFCFFFKCFFKSALVLLVHLFMFLHFTMVLQY